MAAIQREGVEVMKMRRRKHTKLNVQFIRHRRLFRLVSKVQSLTLRFIVENSLNGDGRFMGSQPLVLGRIKP